MSILADAKTRVLVQGITGRQGSRWTDGMTGYGTQVVAGVVPGKGGTTHGEVPVFDTVAEAVDATGADAAVAFVPGAGAAEAVTEAVEAGLRLVVCPADGVPLHDALRMRRTAVAAGAVVVGPNTPGLITPGSNTAGGAKLGFMPGLCYRPGNLGVVAKSGSLSYEVCWRLTAVGIGQSTVVGIGGDPAKGLRLGETLALFHDDPETAALLVVGEIGGADEYEAVEYARRPDAKPMAAFLVGRAAPAGRRLGHAGALVTGTRDGWPAKVAALREAGIQVADGLSELIEVVGGVLAATS